MSLNVYYRKEDIPNNLRYVLYNDGFFIKRGMVDINGTIKSIIKSIDDGELVSSKTFISQRHPDFGALFIDYLSTGCKTAINVYYSAEEGTCIDTISCGYNAIGEILRLPQGNILYPGYSCCVDENEECDIMFNGRHYNVMKDFMMAFHDYEDNID